MGLTQGAAHVTPNVDPAAIGLSKVTTTVLLVGTVMALSAGKTLVTVGGVGATPT